MEKTIDNRQLFVDVKDASLLLRALNNGVRQRILMLLQQHQRLTVTGILIHIRMLQSITSQHLSVLRRAGVVLTKREGKNIFYELNPGKLEDVKKFIEAVLFP